MSAPTAKDRAIALKREGGLSAAVIGAILGLSSGDVQSLLVDADPAVDLPAGGVTPGLEVIKLDPPLPTQDIPTSVPNYGDLEFRVAPTDAENYLFTAVVSLKSRDSALASLQIFATDEATFEDYWNGPGDLLPVTDVRTLINDGTILLEVRNTISVPVAGGQTVGFMRTGVSGGEATPSDDAVVSMNDPGWVALS